MADAAKTLPLHAIPSPRAVGRVSARLAWLRPCRYPHEGPSGPCVIVGQPSAMDGHVEIVASSGRGWWVPSDRLMPLDENGLHTLVCDDFPQAAGAAQRAVEIYRDMRGA